MSKLKSKIALAEASSFCSVQS